jgi:hypothetical protein
MEKRLHTKETIEDVQKRLYDRGAGVSDVVRHGLSDTKVDVSRNWNVPVANTPRPNATDLRTGLPIAEAVSSEYPPAGQSVPEEDTTVFAEQTRPRRRYRSIVLLVSMVVFALMVGTASMFLYKGGNQISGNNIQLQISGPESVGGGEIVPISVHVANQNSVPIESITLILKYPEGTLNTEVPPRTLYEERIPLNNLAPGESQTVPVKIAVYGEENTKKEIEARIEYRVQNSNGSFYKNTNPYAFTLTSAPLVLSVSNVNRVASGQKVEVELKAVSNASAPLRDIVITASYPINFSYSTAEPAPTFRNNVWTIDEILPEQAVSIVIKGSVEGFSNDTFRVGFVAGKSSVDNQYVVKSTLAEAKADFTIEQPFADVSMYVLGDKEPMIGDRTDIRVIVPNSLDSAIYDAVIELSLEGTVLEGGRVNTKDSLYDTRKKTIRWDETTNKSLDMILSGDKREFNISITPGHVETGAYYKAKLNVFARRVSDPGAQEALIGSTELDVRYTARTAIAGQNGRNMSGLKDTGPVPPVVDEATTYTPTIVATAGVNGLTDASVEFSLPEYVEWNNIYVGDGDITYNPINRGILWKIGDMKEQERRELVLQVTMKPPYSLLGRTPVIINQQHFRATDSFSSKRVNSSSPAITTELSTEMGFPARNGAVED